MTKWLLRILLILLVIILIVYNFNTSTFQDWYIGFKDWITNPDLHLVENMTKQMRC